MAESASGSRELTTLLGAAERGDDRAVAELFEALYSELRRIAHAKLRQSERGVLLDTTSLVNESYLRMVNQGQLQASDKRFFLAYAARVMRSVVVDLARRQGADRRGGDQLQVTLNTASAGTDGADDREIVRVHEALEELAKIDERMVRVVEMRYFAGLEDKEIAASLDVSTRTVERDWEKARIFLFATLT
jgi:RNA polymerase sigma factor (TIGR02999 family)